jgi:hypothetical protein
MPRKFRSRNVADRVLPTGKSSARKHAQCLLRTFRWLLHTPYIDRSSGMALYSRQLAELKADLRGALASLETHEQQIASLVKESSQLALDELEQGLKELLSTVEKVKQEKLH